MAEHYQRQSPLAHLALEARALARPETAGVRLSERSFRGQVALRGRATGRKLKGAVKKVLGVALPVEANTASENAEGRQVLWLSPDEWLVVVPDGREGETIAALYEAMSGEHFAAVDVSSSRTVIGLVGRRAREVLMKGLSLDLHPDVFGPGRCVQTTLARCHVLLHQVDDAPGYDLYVHRSFADYLFRWLEDAGREFGVRY